MRLILVRVSETKEFKALFQEFQVPTKKAITKCPVPGLHIIRIGIRFKQLVNGAIIAKYQY